MPLIPRQVAQAALHFPTSSADGDKPEGVEAVAIDGGVLVVTQTVCIVDVPDLAPGRAERALGQVHEALRARGREWAYWALGADQVAVIEALKRLGLVQNERPPWEPRFTAMALVEEPAGEPTEGVTAKPVETLAELHQANDVFAEAFGIPVEARRGLRERAERRFEYESRPDAVTRTYLAFVDGEPAGVASTVFTATVGNLLGGGVLPTARGRGAYRALVSARWRDAVARGTPALTVQAGAMSRPVLEHLGFEPVGGIEVLLDEL
jgi:hypothetical protein